MSRFIFIFLLLIFGLKTAHSQPYQNEWIQYGQNYAKIKVAANGLYRLNHSTLLSLGLPAIGSGYQLYRDGQQVPVYTTTQGNFSASDYLEFVGKPNNGSLDTHLFDDPSKQLTDVRSLFSDTATYFLTWNNTFPNLRYETVENNLTDAPPVETWFWHTTQNTINNQFNLGMPFSNYNGIPLRFSSYDECEGFVGVNIAAGATQSYNLSAPQIYDSAPVNAEITLKIVGRSDNPDLSNDHEVVIGINGTPITNATYDGFGCTVVAFELPLSGLTAGTPQINLTSVGSTSPVDINAASFYRLDYPHAYSFGNADFFSFALPNDGSKYLEIADFNGGDIPVLYDLTNSLRIEAIQGGGLLKFKLPVGLASSSSRNLCLTNTNSGIVQTPTATSVTFTDFSSPDNQGNFIIISHPSLAMGDTNIVAGYADYRASIAGGAHNVQVVSINELYDQFAWGISKHPLSIRNFINYALDSWSVPMQYVLLLGKGVSYSQTTFNAAAANACLVPTYGVPASDALLAARNASSSMPQVAISRVPASTPDQVSDYLTKLIQYENSQSDLFCEKENIWRKDVLFLSQGDTGEVDINTAYLNQHRAVLEGTVGYGGVVKGFFENNKFGTISLPQIGQIINNGVGFVQFAGNANNNGYWLTTINQPGFYTNEGRYPVMLANAGKTGNMFDYATGPSTTMVENYTLAPLRGSAAFMGNTDTKISEESQELTTAVISNFNNLNYGQSLALSLKEAAELTLNASPDDNNLLFTIQTMALAADPALSPVPRKKPDYLLPADEFSFYNPVNGFPILSNPPLVNSQMPGFETRIILKNLGEVKSDSVDLVVTRIVPEGDYLPVLSQRLPSTVYTDTMTIYLPNDLPEHSGFNSFVFTIDGSFEIVEDCEFNNTAFVLADMRPYCITDIGPAVLYALPSQFPITLTPTGEEWLTYQWSNGQTSSSIEVSSFGSYSVTVTNAFGCIAVDNITVTLNTGVETVPFETQINVYPNPATSLLHVQGVEGCRLQLYDLNGSLVSAQTAYTQSAELVLGMLPSGIYLLQVTHPTLGVATFRVLKN